VRRSSSATMTAFTLPMSTIARSGQGIGLSSDLSTLAAYIPAGPDECFANRSRAFANSSVVDSWGV
jgi:hypothetical protein